MSSTDAPTALSNADLSLALLEQAGLGAYERDPLGQHFLLWLTKPTSFAGGALPQGKHGEQGLGQLIHEDDRARVAAALTNALHGDGTYRIDYRLQLGEAGHTYAWVQDAGRIEYAASRLPLKARGVVTHLEPYVSRAEAAEFAEAHDALTGRPNRRQFERQLDGALAAQIAGGVLIVSIDNMTWLNEAIGAAAANDLLMAAIQRLDRLVPKDRCGESDALCPYIARTGGDSFALWLPELTGETVDALAATILQSFREQHFATPDNALHISVSIGMVMLPEQAESGIEAITRAEQALKSGRQVGRSAYRRYTNSDDRRTAHLTSLSDLERVRAAIASDSFVLAFQPIVGASPAHVESRDMALQHGQVAFYEALLRLKNPDGTVSAVFSFIQALELHGLAQEIDRHVLGLAIAKLEEVPDLVLSVNVSGATASDAAFQKFLEQQLGHRPQIATRMILEITETAATKDLAEAQRFVGLAHALGARVALDDFGEGFTALQHLRQLSVDLIKIDGGLIRGICENAGHQVMAKAILSMAQHMGVQTVAEFVEEEREAAWLQRHGADFLQGYYFGKAEVDLPEVVGELAGGTARNFLAKNGYLTLSI